MSINQHTTRRSFFRNTTDGLFGAALASLLSNDVYGQSLESGLAAPKTHFVPKAKAVIHLCMQGGPSQVDLFLTSKTLSVSFFA